MISTIVLASAMQLQVPNIPADAEVIIPQTPHVRATGMELDRQLHSVTYTMTKTEVKVETLTLYKNMSSNGGTATVSLGFTGFRHYGAESVKPTVKWSDKAVAESTRVSTKMPGNSVMMSAMFDVEVKPNATHSLRTTFTIPVGKAGIDREERIVAYDVSPNKKDPNLKDFHFAIKYKPEVVFSPIGTKPDNWGWQVGASGAFIGKENAKFDKRQVFTFRFYPGGF